MHEEECISLSPEQVLLLGGERGARVRRLLVGVVVRVPVHDDLDEPLPEVGPHLARLGVRPRFLDLTGFEFPANFPFY